MVDGVAGLTSPATTSTFEASQQTEVNMIIERGHASEVVAGREVSRYTEYECDKLDLITLIRYDHLGTFAERKALVREMLHGSTEGWRQTDGRAVIATMYPYDNDPWHRPSRFMFRIYENN